MKFYYVYILLCSDGSYYVGVTNSIESRFARHQSGYNISCYTYSRRPLELKYLEVFESISSAITREKQIKRWTRRKKEALINGDLNLLKALSKSNGSKDNGSTGSP